MVLPAAEPLIKVLWYVAVQITLVLVEYKEITFTEKLCEPYTGIFIREVAYKFPHTHTHTPPALKAVN